MSLETKRMEEKTVSITMLRRHFSRIIDEVVQDRTTFVITRYGRPIAALIPYGEFEKLKGAQERKILERYDRLAGEVAEDNRDRTDDEVTNDIAKAIDEVRSEKNESAHDNDD